jgi:hypothetical protein
LTALIAALAALTTVSGAFERITAGESATKVLGEWCATHHLPPIRAVRLGGHSDGRTPAPLRNPQDLRVAFRRVRLSCGGRTLSMAENWYLPARLTSEMNRRLETTDAPFGQVVSPLRFTRRTLSTQRDRQGRLEIRAVLMANGAEPFSYVVERYPPLPR